MLWNFSTPKIKHSTTRMDFQNGGLKKDDALYKITSLQCLWLSQFLDKCKEQSFAKCKELLQNIKFQSNLDFKNDIISFPHYLQKYIFERT